MPDSLFVLWTNPDLVTTHEMVLLYTHNAKKKGWFENVTLIIWGATAEMVPQNPKVQERLKQMIADGVTVSACKACADDLGVSSALEALGIEVKYWGTGLTEALKDPDKSLLTV